MNFEIIQIIENEPKVTSETVAKFTQNKHQSIIDLCKRNIEDFREFGAFDLKSIGKNGTINYKVWFELNEAQATLLMTYLRNSPIVKKFKLQLVQEFFKMREELQNKKSLNRRIVNLNDSRVRELFFIAFDGKCYYTKESLSKTNFHIDHILPKSKGGEDILCNLVVCKPEINQIKSNSYDEEFVRFHQNFVSSHIAPKLESMLNIIDSSFDYRVLFSASVMSKLENLYGRETIKNLYAKLIPDLDYKNSQLDEEITSDYFIDNCVIAKQSSRISTTNLYENYFKFCQDNNIFPYGKIVFFKKFCEKKRVPKLKDLRMGYFDGKKQRFFEGFEVVL